MPNVQLRWHLLREVSEIFVTMLGYYHIDCLSDLLMSGKGPAQAVQMILSRVKLLTLEGNIYVVELTFDNNEYCVELDYFKKLVLQRTHCLEVYKVGCADIIPEFISTLRDYNNVEELRFVNYENQNTASSIINACPKLSHLVVDQTLLFDLLRRENADISKIRSVKIENFYLLANDPDHLVECKFLFKLLAKQPKRCPLLAILIITAHDELMNLSKCISGSAISTVKSLKIDEVDVFHVPGDISNLSTIAASFPNIETISMVLPSWRTYKDNELHDFLEAFKLFESKLDFQISLLGQFIRLLKKIVL